RTSTSSTSETAPQQTATALFEDEAGAKIVSERLEVLERPRDFLVARDLDELGVVRTSVGITEDQVAVGQEFQSRDPAKVDSRQLVTFDAPHDLALGSNLDHSVAVAGGDQGVSIGLA